MRADIHRNLQTGTWSVIDRSTGRVHSHPETTAMYNAELVVQPAGPGRVRKNQRKDVHAFARGEQLSSKIILPEGRPERITYDPYRHDTFVRTEDESPVSEADFLLFLPEGEVWAYGLS